MEFTKLQTQWVEKWFISIDIEKNKITYKNLKNGDKTYKFSDPEEQVRADYFIDLVTKYQYDPENIDLEVEIWTSCKTRYLKWESPESKVLWNYCRYNDEIFWGMKRWKYWWSFL
jgi:hypothetical protein